MVQKFYGEGYFVFLEKSENWSSGRIEMTLLSCVRYMLFCATEARGQAAKFTEHLLR